ncbi:hypothetical protein LIA77_02146 [Sarocladium implicatum]|nr:hypothetical protein LIA77_02146 [Sarocladium implicatum]
MQSLFSSSLATVTLFFQLESLNVGYIRGGAITSIPTSPSTSPTGALDGSPPITNQDYSPLEENA